MELEISDGILIAWLIFCVVTEYRMRSTPLDFEGSGMARQAGMMFARGLAFVGAGVWSLWQLIGLAYT